MSRKRRATIELVLAVVAAAGLGVELAGIADDRHGRPDPAG